MNKKRLLVIYTEGETDEEFYKRLLIEIKKNNNDKNFAFKEIDYFCAKGIMRFRTIIINYFKKKFCVSKYCHYEKVICLCYDLDVFEYSSKPPINWKEVEKSLYDLGADRIIKIIANRCIEDFFLLDIEGIRRYLRLARNQIPKSKKSLDLLEQMFKNAGKQYFKGEKVTDFVNLLDISKIASNICRQISYLCSELGYECDKTKCSR